MGVWVGRAVLAAAGDVLMLGVGLAGRGVGLASDGETAGCGVAVTGEAAVPLSKVMAPEVQI